MDEDKTHEPEYEQMRGEYLSLMASLELNLTFLLAECLDVRNHKEEFQRWFARAPLSLGSKLRLFESMTKNSVLPNQFVSAVVQIRDSNDFRNTLAHSFRQFGRTMTARGREIPAEYVTFQVLRGKLVNLRQLENLISNMLADAIQGPLPPISANDFADWPP